VISKFCGKQEAYPTSKWVGFVPGQCFISFELFRHRFEQMGANRFRRIFWCNGRDLRIVFDSYPVRMSGQIIDNTT
jgi:hypothetical protein